MLHILFVHLFQAVCYVLLLQIDSNPTKVSSEFLTTVAKAASWLIFSRPYKRTLCMYCQKSKFLLVGQYLEDEVTTVV